MQEQSSLILDRLFISLQSGYSAWIKYELNREKPRQPQACLRKRSKEGQSYDMKCLPSSLLLSPLWETCPPLDGPGVPSEGVEWISSMSFQDAGFWEVRESSKHQWRGDKAIEERERRERKRWKISTSSNKVQHAVSKVSKTAACKD